jgi:hypothetical protein
MRTIIRRQTDHTRCERVEAELLGGPEDGTRLVLDVVRDGPQHLRVLEANYQRAFSVVRSSDVESPRAPKNRRA